MTSWSAHLSNVPQYSNSVARPLGTQLSNGSSEPFNRAVIGTCYTWRRLWCLFRHLHEALGACHMGILKGSPNQGLGSYALVIMTLTDDMGGTM